MGNIGKRLDRVEATLRQRQKDEEQPYDVFADIARTALAFEALARGKPLPGHLTDEERRDIIESHELIRQLAQGPF